MEELKWVQELRVDEFSRHKLIEDQNTVNELLARIQELQNEVNCMNDARDFKDAESVRSGQLSHVPSKPALFPSPRGELGGMLSRDQSLRPDIWNPHGISGNVLLVYMRMLWHLMQECSILGTLMLRETSQCKLARGNPLQKVVIKAMTPSLLRDFYEDRQPRIRSTQ